jgi:rhodanese-related sulfurtransferase
MRQPFRRCLSMMCVDEENTNIEVSPFSDICSTKSQAMKSNENQSEVNDENDSSGKGSVGRLAFKRPDALRQTPVFNMHKKRRGCSTSHVSDHTLKPSTSLNNGEHSYQRSFSETAVTIMNAVQRSDQDPDLIGDFSKSYALPLIQGKHQDLKTISPSTLAALIQGKYSDLINKHTVIDCRYPYEFIGGHISGALNMFTREAILEAFFNENSVTNPQSQQRHVLVFHCEFSSERGPTLLRFMRQKDRDINIHSYPKLHYPEIYVLNGGYKAFFENHQELCEPRSYIPMQAQEHKEDMRLCRAKSKSWTCEMKWSGFGSSRAPKF